MSVLPRSSLIEHEVEVVDLNKKKEAFCEYAYDFENNELKTKNGKHYYVYGNEAMKIWIYKCMITGRFKHSAYTDRFGSEVFDLVGEVISDSLKKEEIKRYITEAVMVHPYMQAITKMDLKTCKSGVEVDVYYRTIFKEGVESVSCIVPMY